MNTITTLQTIAKLVLAFLLALLPLHELLAQEKSTEKTKQLHIKMIREVNGQTQVIDTVVEAADHEALFNSLRTLKVDTAMARRLRSSLGGTFRFDTTMVVRDIRTKVYNSLGAEMDTAEFRKLHGGKIRVYQMDKALNAADRKVFLERIKMQDTTMYRRLQGEGDIFRINVDSLKGDFQSFEMIKGTEAVKIGSGHPAVFLRASKNSDGVFMIQRDSAARTHLDPAQIDRIVVQRIGNVISLDSLRGTGAKKVQIKVINDKETGASKVYKTDEQGNEVEMKVDYLKLDHGDARIMIFMKANVEDITAADKQTLKEAGAPVELKPRHALDVEEISFYPNPNNGRFNLSFTLDNKGTTRVSVMDSQGKEVFVDTVAELSGQYNRQIDLTPFGPGLYFLQIAQGKKYHTKRILVN